LNQYKENQCIAESVIKNIGSKPISLVNLFFYYQKLWAKATERVWSFCTSSRPNLLSNESNYSGSAQI
jgi:hypothetical protein